MRARFVRANAVVCLFVMLVATACSGGGGDTTTGSTRDTLRALLISRDMNLFDPITAGPANTQGQLMHLLFDALVRYKPGNTTIDTIEPDLAEKWEELDGGKTWKFTLRKGVQFNSGYGELTSDDVKFSFERQKDKAKPGSYAGELANITEIVTADPYTVEFRLKDADPFFLTVVANYHGGFVVSKKAVQERGKDFTIKPIGSGPFVIESYAPTDKVVMVANPNYWRGKPKLNKLEYLFIPDASAQLLALKSGSVDIGRIAQTSDAVNEAKAAGLIVDLVAPIPWNLHFNMQSTPALKDLRVRQALLYGTDRKALASYFGEGLAVASDQLMPSGVFAGPESIPDDLKYTYNVDKAKQLLAEAGYGTGLSFDIVVSEASIYPPTWQILQEQWKKIGVTLNLKSVDHQTFNTQLDNSELNMAVHGGSRAPIADIFLREWFAKDGKSNISFYGTAMPGIDSAIDGARAKLAGGDEPGAIADYRQAALQVLRDLPAIPLFVAYTPVVRAPGVNLGYEVKDSLVYADQVTNETTVSG